ncbi:hypothetical protein GC197_07920 [bacterium]|nr:hypothetical protein [bacterium]
MNTLFKQHFLRERLANAAPIWSVLFASVMSFSVYFCMYAFRKPLAVATYAGYTFGDTGIELKTAIVISQLIGYVVSKYVGVKFCSQIERSRLWIATVLLIVFSEVALLAFAVVPPQWKVVAIFFNGLPLGMVWGLAMRYLEGRRATEFLVATLSCSYIFATGLVKDVGQWLLDYWTVDPFWMPFCVGIVFLLPFLLSAWLLDMVPPPDVDDVQERSERTAMNAKEQWAFLAHFSFGMILLTVIYVFLTALRDFRDNFAVEMLKELNLAKVPGIFTTIESVGAIVITLTLGGLSLFRQNRHALFATFAIMLTGTVVLGGSTFAFQFGWMNGLTWMILVGLGAYLAYVPYTVLFDRVFALTRATGTSVFAIYLIDSFGYTGSAAMQIYRDMGHADRSRLSFFIDFSLLVSAIGFVALLISAIGFIREERRAVAAMPIAEDA